jgi:hypothetical protein
MRIDQEKPVQPQSIHFEGDDTHALVDRFGAICSHSILLNYLAMAKLVSTLFQNSTDQISRDGSLPNS